MRYLIFVAFALVSTMSSRAADQVITVTPQNLAGWTITGANRDTMASANQLVLSAGAQMSREFADKAVILHLVSRQVFSEQPENWPIIGLGSVALALIRQGGQGRLVLVTNETTATPLPWTVTLDTKSKDDPIELFLAYDSVSGVVLVSFQNQVQSFDLAPSTTHFGVWLSAGATADWSLDVLQVMLLTPGANPTGPKANPGANTAQTSLPDKFQAVLNNLQAFGSAPETTGGALGGTNTSGLPKNSFKLEVFTPPSVRRAQVINVVRSTIAKAQAQ
jgi:hypothetical protein